MMSILKQAWSYIKSTNIKRSKMPLINYAMVTNYQLSFLVKVDKVDESIMYVSKPFANTDLLRLIYLLFLLRYEDYVPLELKEFVNQIHVSFPTIEPSSKEQQSRDRSRDGDDSDDDSNDAADDTDDSDDDVDYKPRYPLRKLNKSGNSGNSGKSGKPGNSANYCFIRPTFFLNRSKQF